MEFLYEASRRKTFDGHKHYHSSYEFYFMESGRCGFLMDDQLYDVQEGDLVVVTPQVIHLATYSGAHARLLITCSPDAVEGFPPPRGGVYRNLTMLPELRALFREAEAEAGRRDAYSPMLFRGILCRLTALLERQPNLYPANRHANALIGEVLGEINREYSGELTLQAVAARHGVSPAHLSRSFKRETGMNFNRYLSLLRLKKAEQLLRRQPELSIGEIAFSCGFNDSNYFSEKFRATYGCTPSACRKGRI